MHHRYCFLIPLGISIPFTSKSCLYRKLIVHNIWANHLERIYKPMNVKLTAGRRLWEAIPSIPSTLFAFSTQNANGGDCARVHCLHFLLTPCQSIYTSVVHFVKASAEKITLTHDTRILITLWQKVASKCFRASEVLCRVFFNHLVLAKVSISNTLQWPVRTV